MNLSDSDLVRIILFKKINRFFEFYTYLLDSNLAKVELNLKK